MISNIDTGNRIKDLAMEKGYSVDLLASYLGISQIAVYRWCEGYSLPTIDRLLEISKLVGVPINDLLVEVA